ncbi:MAG: DNA repair protein RecN [Saprospiraceae bacterium]|nr:DNA repair protein RecN [Saprospiraceae bacterium]
MIQSLHIRNYAIIESLEINFSDGLTIITGETGAGKSILLGALGLIMGDRADTKSLYNESQKCVIEGNFNIRPYNLSSFFEAYDLDFDEDLIVRREIAPSGKSRAFINDTPVNLKVLQNLSSSLIDLHQQFDTLDIHKVSFQLRMLDALAGNKELLENYQALYNQYNQNRKRLAKLVEATQSASKEMDYNQFLLDELHQAELIAGEQQELDNEHSRLANAEDIKQTLGGVFQQLVESEHAILGQMQELQSNLLKLGKVDQQVDGIQQQFAGLMGGLEELANECEKIAENTEYDQERIMALNERLLLLDNLQKKHQVATVEELLAIQEDLEEKLSAYSNSDAEIHQLEQEIEQQEEKLRARAEKLRKSRANVIPDFEKKVHEMLAQLAMPAAKMQVVMDPAEQLSSTGYDEVYFLFAANKGSRMQQIKDVASGGELARLTLVTKSLVASAIPLPTLIFDEIDTGISGDVALRMGNILRVLSNHHQVVSITHSPQIAAKADSHYFIYKLDKEDRTITKVRLLDQEERIRAIATMLSQNPPSDSAIENARELITNN